MPYVDATSLAKAYRFHRLATGYGRKARNATYALKLAREDVAAGKARHPFMSATDRPWGGVSWQPERRGIAHIDQPELRGFRLVGEVTAETPYRDLWNNGRNGKGGWYTDPFGDVFRDGSGLCYGVVYQLPGHKGEARFVAGYEFGGTDGGPTLDLSRVYAEPAGGDAWNLDARELDAARDAARAADSMAQSAAEDEREYQTAWQAGSQWADLGGQIRDAGKALNAMAKECKAARQLADKFPAMREAIAARYADLLADIRDMRTERAKLKSGDADRLCFYPDGRLTAAFNEGAGL